MLESLDFLYVPAADIDASIGFYTKLLGGELLWKIHDFGVWVACIRPSPVQPGPYVLLANHIEKKDVMLIYRVKKLDEAVALLKSKGWEVGERIEIPPGPCYTLRDPAQNAIVIYENQRPFVMDHFAGRVDSG